jgi:sarcosine oxidase
MSDRYDVIVFGVGAMGSATCYELARRGVRVLGLEQFDIPHDKGSSHGFSRLIRLAYYEHPDYVPLLRRAWDRWGELETAAGQTLLHRTGVLYLGAPTSTFLAGCVRSAELHGLALERLTRADAGRRYPQFRVPDDFIGLFEPTGGFLLSERCIAAHARLAIAAGAGIRGRKAVRSWEVDGSGVSVPTADGSTFRADRLVFCGGAWSDKLVTDLGVPLKVSRQTLGWVRPKDPSAFDIVRFPCWMIDIDGDACHYGFPMLPDGPPGLKIAKHFVGPRTDPDTLDRTPRPEDDADYRDCLKDYIPMADGPVLSQRVCMYTNSPDGHFILDHHPRWPGRVSIACGFSGHGFKFASVVGEIMADLATVGRTELPVEFLSLKRFG